MYEVLVSLNCAECEYPLPEGTLVKLPVQIDMISGQPFVVVPCANVQKCQRCAEQEEF